MWRKFCLLFALVSSYVRLLGSEYGSFFWVKLMRIINEVKHRSKLFINGHGYR